MKTRKYGGNNPEKLSEFPNFSVTGSIAGMKKNVLREKRLAGETQAIHL